MPLPDGEYRLTVVSQLLTFRVPVSVSFHGQNERVLLTVVPANIRESVSVSAPADEAPLSVSPGMMAVKVTASGFADQSRSVTVSAAHSVRADFSLQRQ